MRDERRPDVADEDRGAELDGDTVGIVAEPHGGILLQLLVRHEVEGFAVDLAHAHGETDGVATFVNFAGIDLDLDQIGRVEGHNGEGDLVAGIQLLTADVQHGGKDVEGRREGENAVGGLAGASLDLLVDFLSLDLGREVADRGGDLFLVVSFLGVKIVRP